MKLTYDELRQLISDSVDESFLKHKHECILNDAGITDVTHIQHHRVLGKISNDIGKVRVAFLAGILVTISGGIFGLIWLGLKTKLLGGQ